MCIEVLLIATATVAISPSEIGPPRIGAPVPLSELTVSSGEPLARHRVPNDRTALPMRTHRATDGSSVPRPARPVGLSRLSAPPGADRVSLTDVRPALARLQERLGVEVHVSAEDLHLAGATLHAPAAPDVEAILPVLETELGRYTASFLADVGVRSIYLAGAIRTASGDLVGGLAATGSPPLVVRPAGGGGRAESEQAVLESGSIAISIGGPHRVRSLSRVVHHEVFHFIQMHPKARRLLAGWASLNPEDSPYLGTSGVDYFSDGIHYSARRCFITRYARSNADEDQAEVYAALMLDAESALERGMYDPCLGEKIVWMQEVMAQLAERR